MKIPKRSLVMDAIRPDARPPLQGHEATGASGGADGAFAPPAGRAAPSPNREGARMALHVTEVQKALKGADYPASRDDLVSLAESNDAGGEVVEALRGMDDGSFDSPADVMKGLGGALGAG
jgi:hypothetical protein